MKKGNIIILTMIIIAVAISASVLTWFYATKLSVNNSAPQAAKNEIDQSKAIVSQNADSKIEQEQDVSVPQPKTESDDLDEIANWKTFVSPSEGFTLRYPGDWTLEDKREFSDKDDKKCSKPASNCPDDFEFRSPDKLVAVNYYAEMIYLNGDYNKDDKFECGVQSYCDDDIVIDLKMISIPNYGDTYLIKRSGKGMNLHKPLSADTTPIIGNNKHNNFNINYSLSRKDGGRYNIRISHFSNKKNGLDNMSDGQFFQLDSVKKAEMIMKSLSY